MPLESLESVLATHELDVRPSRPPNHAGENEALRELMAIYGERPETVLARLVEIVTTRCEGAGAGFSILERGPDGHETLRWLVTAGAFAPFQGRTVPRAVSPGNVVISQRRTQLMVRPARSFAVMEDPDHIVYEELIAPFLQDGEVVGTLWVVTHDEERHFDAEDRRMLESLALFASTAWQRHVSQQTAQAVGAALLARVENERLKLEQTYSETPAFIAVLRGPNLILEYANDPYFALVGHRDVLGKPLKEAFPELEGQGFEEILRDVMRTGVTLDLKERSIVLQRERGGPLEERFADLRYAPVRESDGTISGVYSHGTDVTDSVRARRELAESEERFRTVFEEAPDDAVIIMDADRVLLAWNPAAERVCGWKASEAIGHPADLIFTPEDRATGAPIQESFVAARDGKAADERWHVRRDGTRFWGSGTMSALHHEDGSVRGYLKIFRDATARRQAEAERENLLVQVRAERERIVALVESAPAFVALLEGPELKFTYANEAYYALVGHRDLVGLPLRAALPETAGQGFFELVEGVFLTGESFMGKELPYQVQRLTGQEMAEGFVTLLYQAMREADGTVYGVFVHGVDVTEQVLARRAAERLNQELEIRVERRTEELVSKNQELEGFTYSVSHDMRAPLRAMITNASIVLEDEGSKVSPDGQKRLERLKAAAKRMALLLDDLLSYARLGTRELRIETVDLSSLALEVTREIDPDFGDCAAAIDIEAGLQASCDPRLVGMALQNLFENACKYRKPDSALTVKFGGYEKDGLRVFYVRDNGIGFDMAFVDKLFQPFERLHREEYAGTGIGLANVRRAIERHGGRVWAEGSPGEGATFSFTLA